MTITGMHCAQCAVTVGSKLKSLNGISDTTISFAGTSARITFNPDLISPEQIERQIIRSGFGIMTDSLTIILAAVPDQTALPKIKSALETFDGIFSITIDQYSPEIALRTNPDTVNATEIKSALSANGFMVDRIIPGSEHLTDPGKTFRREQQMRLLRSGVAFSVSIPLMILMQINHHVIPANLLAGIAIPVFLFVSFPIYLSAVRALKARNLTMEVAYALGITAAFSASIANTFGIAGMHDFMLYDTAIMLTGFLTFGRFLETRARGKTGDAVKKLIALQPVTAMVDDNGTVRPIPVEEVIPGQIIIIRPGDKIPVDGEVISGSASIDESMISGEPFPVSKQAGSNVTAGTINQTGILRFIATRVGSDTMLAAIIRMVRRAQASRPPMQRITDIAVSLFIPVILTLSFFSFTVWYFILGSTFHFAFTTMIAVLVIACPCVLGLASPTAVVVGIGRGAQLGILIKNGDVLERAPSISRVAFDKTGTLTEGKPGVAAIEPVACASDDLLCRVASLESCSTHPIATSIVNEARRRGLAVPPCDRANVVNGKGITGLVGSRRLIVGNRRLMVDEAIDITGIESTAAGFEERGMTVVFVADNGKPAGCIAIADNIKPSARNALDQLRRRGISCSMLSGDTRRSAEAIAGMLGITDVHTELLPHDKAAIIKMMQQSGDKVAFIGDGINDAPALATADVGMAIGGGTDIAAESADIILVKGDPADAATALRLACKVFARIKGNLFWAFAYNAALIPLAAGMLHPFFSFVFKPEFAGLAMALSSVTVVTRSLMLQRFVPENSPVNAP